MKILFLNSTQRACGVYQYGIRLANCLPMCDYREVANEADYFSAIEQRPDKIIYNYHSTTMPWLTSSNICRTAKNVGIPHECNGDIFDELLDIDPLKPNGIPRPLFYDNIPEKPADHEDFIMYNRGKDVPIFGSFGFGFLNKGFDEIIQYVNTEFDDAIIKLIIPCGHYCRPEEQEQVVEKCFSFPRKSGIELLVCTDFFSNEDLLVFLNSNTMNLFLYSKMEGRGISSVIDYALSVDVPIGISDSCMFRNIYDDSICVYKNKISDIMKIQISKKYREIYSRENIVEKIVGKQILDKPSVEEIVVSIGELVDKYSILEIKQRCIRDSKKLADVKREIESIAIAKKYIDAYPQFYHQLVYINQKIWDFTDEIKALEKNIDQNTDLFARISSNIFAFNQKRFRLKKYFNDLNNSTIKEQKSYAEDARFVENVRGKLDVLAFLCIEYDSIYVSEPVNLPNPNLFVKTINEIACIDLDKVDFDVPEVFRPIYYTASGLLGDFIIQLSVICENYYRTGRKGVLTMTDAVPFRRGLLKTYEDIRPIVIAQPYIQDFTLDYFPESSVYLGTWRENRLLHKVSWAELLLDEYGIHYGNHKWIHTENRSEWNSKVIIHTVSYRFPINLDFSTIVREHGIENIVFLGEKPALLEKSTYDIFMERTGVHIPHVYVPETFAEMCVAINSCKLFVGALSMPLTIAQACKVPHIIGYSGIPDVDRMN